MGDPYDPQSADLHFSDQVRSGGGIEVPIGYGKRDPIIGDKPRPAIHHAERQIRLARIAGTEKQYTRPLQGDAVAVNGRWGGGGIRNGEPPEGAPLPAETIGEERNRPPLDDYGRLTESSYSVCCPKIETSMM